jgi:hypothetical protein
MKKMPKRPPPILARDEEGFVLIAAIILLAVLSLIAATMSRTTINELRVTTNINTHKSAFNAAESGLSYVVATPSLYGSENLDPDNPKSLSKALTADSTFTVEIKYQGPNSSENIMRGSGFSAGKFRAHNYRINSTGDGPLNSNSRLRAEGYRIGF